jgi:hypothetical protein
LPLLAMRIRIPRLCRALLQCGTSAVAGNSCKYTQFPPGPDLRPTVIILTGGLKAKRPVQN